MRRSKLREALSSPYAPLLSFWALVLADQIVQPSEAWTLAMIGALFALAGLGMWLNHAEIRALCRRAESEREEFRRELRRERG